MGPNYSLRTRSSRTKITSRKSPRSPSSSKQALIKKTKKQALHSSRIINSPSKSSSSSNNNNNNDDEDEEFPKTEGIVFEAIDDKAIGNDNINVSSSPISSVSGSSNSSNGCSTPKGQKFRIPEMVNCPPAPKKQRLEASNCSLRRSPIAFFAPPDLELFFYYALRGISV